MLRWNRSPIRGILSHKSACAQASVICNVTTCCDFMEQVEYLKAAKYWSDCAMHAWIWREHWLYMASIVHPRALSQCIDLCSRHHIANLKHLRGRRELPHYRCSNRAYCDMHRWRILLLLIYETMKHNCEKEDLEHNEITPPCHFIACAFKVMQPSTIRCVQRQFMLYR